LARQIAEHTASDAQPPPLTADAADQQPERAVTEAYLWPENESTWRAWQELQTQWRVGMGGATGLDYTAVRAYLDEAGLQGPARADVWTGVRAAERETLAVWAEQRKRDALRREFEQSRGPGKGNVAGPPGSPSAPY
jgi:hypothetical protein